MSGGVGLVRAAMLVGVGGFAGTLARYGLSVAVPDVGEWPVATLTVNVAGAFALGLLLEALARVGGVSGSLRGARLTLGTGFLGSFTTYSSLAVETERLVATGSGALAAGYAGASLVAGLLACVLGVFAGSVGTRQRRRSSDRAEVRS